MASPKLTPFRVLGCALHAFANSIQGPWDELTGEQRAWWIKRGGKLAVQVRAQGFALVPIRSTKVRRRKVAK